HRPKPGPKDETTNDPDFFQSLELPLINPDDAWLTPDVNHDFTIYNPDGQKAVWSYKISPAKELKATAAAAEHVTVQAPGFSPKDNFQYDENGTINVIKSVQSASKPYTFDIDTGAAAGRVIKIKATKASASGGQSALSNDITVQ